MTDSFEYMTNKAFVGFKLNNLSYKNEAYFDNHKKINHLTVLDSVSLEEHLLYGGRKCGWFKKNCEAIDRRYRRFA